LDSPRVSLFNEKTRETEETFQRLSGEKKEVFLMEQGKSPWGIQFGLAERGRNL